MANEIKAEIILDLDSLKAQLLKAEDLGKASGKKLGEEVGSGVEGAFSKIGSLFGQFKGAIASAAAAIAAVGAELHLAFEGEQIAKISAQFDALTNKFGIAGETLKSGLESSAKGLIDTTDLLQVANKALVEFGSNASRLPELLDAARKASIVFGGDTVDNLEKINLAIASGSTRQLRSIGIFVDSTKAIKEYAKALNLPVEVLNETAKQQAVLNAVLAESARSNAKTNESVIPLTLAYQRFKISLKEAFDTIATFTSSTVGPTFANLFSGLTGIVNGLSDTFKSKFGNSAESAAAKVKILTEEQESLRKSLEDTQKAALNSDFPLPGNYFDKQKNRLEEIGAQISALKASAGESSPKVGDEKPSGTLSSAAAIDFTAQQEAIKAFNNNVISLDSARIAALQANAVSSDDFAKIRAEQILLIEDQRLAQLEELRLKYSNQAIVDLQAYQASVDSINQTAALKTQATNTKLLETSRSLANSVSQTITKAISGSVQILVNGLLESKNAFADVGKFFLKLLGSLATEMGETLILAGVGIESLFGLEGAGAIAAGIGLVALGAVLSSFAGGGSGVAGGGQSAISQAGGGIASQGEFIQQQEVKPQTQVQVIVNGNIFNNKETALQIAEIINEGFGSNGVKYNTG